MSLQNHKKQFNVEPGFCGNCGTILPIMSHIPSMKCVLCGTQHGPEAYGLMESHYVIHFHTPEDYKGSILEEEGAEGPVISRKCRKCGNNKMSYSTLQLRSADEGQTVFYKCTKCKFNECENS